MEKRAATGKGSGAKPPKKGNPRLKGTEKRAQAKRRANQKKK